MDGSAAASETDVEAVRIDMKTGIITKIRMISAKLETLRRDWQQNTSRQLKNTNKTDGSAITSVNQKRAVNVRTE